MKISIVFKEKKFLSELISSSIKMKSICAHPQAVTNTAEDLNIINLLASTVYWQSFAS